MRQNRLYIGRHNWKHLGRNQDTDGDKSTNDGEQKGPYKGEETKAQEEKVWHSVPTVESMVFTLSGLLPRKASHEGCRGKLHFYTHLTK